MVKIFYKRLHINFFAWLFALSALFFFPLSLTAQNKNQDDTALRFTLYPVKRTLVVLPFRFLNGEGNGAYLSTGLPKVMLAELESVPFIVENDPNFLFYVEPCSKESGTRCKKHSGYPAGISPKKNPSNKEGVRMELEVKLYPGIKGNDIRLSQAPKTLAHELGCDYLVTGEYRVFGSGADARAEVTLFFYNAVTGETKTEQDTISEIGSYSGSRKLTSVIQNWIGLKAAAEIEVTAEKSGAFVYLNDHYMGRTPLKSKFLTGAYRLRVTDDDSMPVEKNINLTKNTLNTFHISLTKKNPNGKLSITTHPAGASIFLNEKYLGKSPLVREDIETGTHRIRASLDGYADEFAGVEVRESRSVKKVSMKLKQGDTLAYYKNRNYVLSDWTHDDFAYASWSTSLFLYAGWIYFNVQGNRVKESLRYEIPLLTYASLPSHSLYDFQKIEANRIKAKREYRKANFSAGASVFALLTGGYFLIRGIMLDDKSFGEVSDGFPVFDSPVTFRPFVYASYENLNAKTDHASFFMFDYRF